MRTATAELTQQLQQALPDAEAAQFLHVSGESLAKARSADMTFRPRSLEAPTPSSDRLTRNCTT